MYRTTLSSTGNPDFGQSPDRPMSPTETVETETVEQAAEALVAYTDRYDLGAGNIAGADVMRGNEAAAWVSYNGRVWPPRQHGAA